MMLKYIMKTNFYLKIAFTIVTVYLLIKLYEFDGKSLQQTAG